MRANLKAVALVVFAAALALLLTVPSASADILRFQVTDLKPEPSVTSSADGFAFLRVDTVAKTLKVTAVFSGLTALPTVAHIHGPTDAPGSGNAGVIVPFANFPLETTSNAYLDTINLALANSYSTAFLTANGGSIDAAFAAFVQILYAKTAYVNIHTQTFGSGEIRGFIEPFDDLQNGNLYATGGNVQVTVEPSSAVYTDTLYVSGALFVEPDDKGPVITNKLVPGTSFNLGRGDPFYDIIFDILVEAQGGDEYILSSQKYFNPDGSIYVRISQLGAMSFRIAFEDRLDGQPDRPEAPQLPKDFNDFVFTVGGIFYYDIIDLVEDLKGLSGDDGFIVYAGGAASARAAVGLASTNEAGPGTPNNPSSTLPAAWKDLVTSVLGPI